MGSRQRWRQGKGAAAGRVRDARFRQPHAAPSRPLPPLAPRRQTPARCRLPRSHLGHRPRPGAPAAAWAPEKSCRAARMGFGGGVECCGHHKLLAQRKSGCKRRGRISSPERPSSAAATLTRVPQGPPAAGPRRSRSSEWAAASLPQRLTGPRRRCLRSPCPLPSRRWSGGRASAALPPTASLQLPHVQPCIWRRGLLLCTFRRVHCLAYRRVAADCWLCAAS